MGTTVIRGLTQDETEEFLRLSPIIGHLDAGEHRTDFTTVRYLYLRGRLEMALQEDAVEGLTFWREK
jgi:hypothetical protein